MVEQKEAVALSSVFASAFMAVMKLTVGLMTGSLGILSEAAHSLLDLGAATLTYFAVRVSDKPADDKHPYGHGKIESVSALIETGLLFVASAWIVKEAAERLLSDGAEVETTWYAVAVIVISILIDVSRARALMKVARETGSQALEADALHFSSDILSSAVVLVGLGLVALGWPKGDAVAALAVACFVFLAGFRLGKRTIDVLVDTAPDGVAERVADIAAGFPQVVAVERVRARPAGSVIFAEALVKVSRTLPFDQVRALCAEVADRVRADLPNVDVLVHAEPLALDDESVAETVRVLAAARALSVHDIAVYEVAGRKHVSFDLEVDEGLTILEAHDIATELERTIRDDLGGEVAVDTHIDPRRSRVVEGRNLDPATLAEHRRTIGEIAAGLKMVENVHHIHIQQDDEGLYIAFHCAFAGDLSIKVVHEATVRLEHRVRDRIRGVARVIAHAEPVRHTDAV